ncbi:cupin domain-containing protein [Microbacterium indicum]|uniref:cupin domain-containing protein n=1 Tax=Microbacterium indicum TaxID=358100 RepID=UPI0004282E32|nr:cupin domain-containing protein [Microbacterium indicum]
MNIEPESETILNPEDRFPGGVYLDHIVLPHDESLQRTIVGKVRFLPGARTAWHSHARGQYLHVIDGVGRFGNRAGEIIEVRAGQTLYTPPNEERWHAAAPGHMMAHYAILEADGDAETPSWWGEQVTDEEFEGRA